VWAVSTALSGPIDKVIQISGGTCANLHIIAVFDDAEMSTSSLEPVES
jgi:hypothetical protein